MSYKVFPTSFLIQYSMHMLPHLSSVLLKVLMNVFKANWFSESLFCVFFLDGVRFSKLVCTSKKDSATLTVALIRRILGKQGD